MLDEIFLGLFTMMNIKLRFGNQCDALVDYPVIFRRAY